MLSGLTFLIVALLALFESVRYWHARSRKNPDWFELRDDVDGLLKRESTRNARERSALRRTVERDSAPPPDDAGPVSDSPIGGVVRKEVIRGGFPPPYFNRQRGA